MTTTLVLVHGGGFDRRCWDLMIPHLRHPALAVDLPGRGGDGRPLRSLGIGDSVDQVVADIEAADLDDVVLVGHSLAGVTLPGVVGRVPDRLRHVVFVACSVPAHGQRVLDTLDPGVAELAEAAGDLEPAPLPAELAADLFCPDMDAEQRAWTLDRLVAESTQVIFEPVDRSGLDRTRLDRSGRDGPVGRTWVRLARDSMVEPAQQDEAITSLAPCAVVDLDAEHMAMVTHPEALAEILDQVADSS